MNASEYKLRAAYLYNFSKFIRWPASAFSDDEAAFVIGLIGEDAPMENFTLLASRKIGSHPIEVRQYKTTAQLTECHLLYIHNSQRDMWMPLVKELKNKPIVTVGDDEAFAKSDGMIQFITIRNRLRFIINLKVAKAAGFDLDSRFLSLALELLE